MHSKLRKVWSAYVYHIIQYHIINRAEVSMNKKGQEPTLQILYKVKRQNTEARIYA